MNFKKEWSDMDHKRVNNAITRYLSDITMKWETGIDKGEKKLFIYESMNQFLGFAYINSGDYAVLSINNVILKLDSTWNYEWFAIEENGDFYAVLMDKDENLKYIKIN